MFVVWSNGAELGLIQPSIRGESAIAAKSYETSINNKNLSKSTPSTILQIGALSKSLKVTSTDLSDAAISKALHEFKLALEDNSFKKMFA